VQLVACAITPLVIDLKATINAGKGIIKTRSSTIVVSSKVPITLSPYMYVSSNIGRCLCYSPALLQVNPIMTTL
jgi:hypothetical protein